MDGREETTLKLSRPGVIWFTQEQIDDTSVVAGGYIASLMEREFEMDAPEPDAIVRGE